MTDEDAGRFAGTAQFYAEHRPGYGEAVIEYLIDRFALDDDARVLDLGCGTGQLAIPLAAHAGAVVGMDPNGAMLRQARQRAAAAGVDDLKWVRGSDAALSDASLSDAIGPVRLVTIGRAFHWMDQRRTLDVVHSMTEPDGGVAIVDDTNWFTQGTKDWQDAVYDLVGEYLDDLPERAVPDEIEYDDPWDELVESFGFDVETRTFEREREWTVDGIVGYVFSLSYCSPESFGDDADAFEAELRELLGARDEDVFRQDATVDVIAGVR